MRALPAPGRPARYQPARVHQTFDGARDEAVVHEDILVDAQRREAAFEVAGAVVLDAMAQREVLGARGRADRVGLDEAERVDGALQRGGTEQAAADGESAQIVEGYVPILCRRAREDSRSELTTRLEPPIRRMHSRLPASQPPRSGSRRPMPQPRRTRAVVARAPDMQAHDARYEAPDSRPRQ